MEYPLVSSSDLSSRCLLCQSTVEEPRSPYLSAAYAAWDKSCATSLCQMFSLNEDPFENVFSEAEYCSSCRLLIRNIDFTIKSLNCLQQNLTVSRENVEALLKENYENIKGSEDTGIKQEPLESDFLSYASSSWAKSYSSTVKFLFETVSSKSFQNPVILSVSSVKLQKKSKKQARPVRKRKIYANRNASPDYDNLTSGSSRLKRSTTIPSYRDFEISDTEEPDHGNDSDFKLEVEAILSGDDEEDADFMEDKIESDPDLNSDDSDWVTSHISPKKKSSRNQSGTEKKSKTTKKLKSNSNHGDGIRKSRSTKPKYTCTFDDKCTFSSRSQIKLQAHIYGVHNGDKRPFQCEVCKAAAKDRKQYAFGSITGYNYHQKKCHPTSESTIICEICKKSFFEKWELKRHMARTHAEINTKLKCFHCKKMFDEDKPDELAKHELLHNSLSRPFACVLCDKQDYTNSYDLSVHVSQEHEDSLLKCEVCKKAFKTIRKLKDHIIATHKERNPALQCTICPYRALWPSALARHIERHSAQRNFQCEKCPNRYKSQHCLNYHLRVTHGKDRTYKCTVCERSFGSSCMLKSHEETHNTVKSYYCELCGKAFMSKKYLGQHMRGHAGTLKKYPQSKAARARQPKLPPPPRNVTFETISNTNTSGEFDDEIEEVPTRHRNTRLPIGEAAGSSNVQFRDPLRLSRDHGAAGPSGPSANAISIWSGEQHPYHRMENASGYQDQQNSSTLDLSQGAQFLSILQQQHAIANNYYSNM